jgi:protein sidekick
MQSKRFIFLNIKNISQCSKLLKHKIFNLANPPAQYKWMKDGVPLTEFKEAVFYKISNAAKNDSGSYQCIAKNDIGVIFSEKSEVIVAFMDDFKNTNERLISVESGRSVILDMNEVNSVPQPTSIWESNKGIVRNNIKYFITQNNQLIILAIESEDSRSGYRARATNTQIGKEIIDSYIYLNITGNDNIEIAPEIILPLKDQKVVRGKTIALECVANARPLYEVEINWYFNGLPIENSGLDYAPELWNRKLNLLSVDETFQGDYECRAQMKTDGYEIKSSKAKLTVIEPPQFESPIQSEMTAEYYSRIDIPCVVNGQPEPFVTWFENTEAIDLSSGKYKKKEDNTLVIENLQQAGVFQCLASNEAGEKSSYTWVKVPCK